MTGMFKCAILTVSTCLLGAVVLAGGRPQDGRASAFILPTSVCVGSDGNFLVADKSAHRVYKVDPRTGNTTVFAGTGAPGFSGDGGPAGRAGLFGPYAVVADKDGNLFVSDSLNHRIRRIDARTGVISTFAGNGKSEFSGDGGPALVAGLNGPSGLAFDPRGNLLIADSFNHRVRRIEVRTGKITTVAGNGTAGFAGDDGPAAAASLNGPRAVAVDEEGNVFIADLANNRIRRVDARLGFVSTIAGDGGRGWAGDGGPATDARLFEPSALAFEDSDVLLIADAVNHRIRRLYLKTGLITTMAGSGEGGFGGDGGPATGASLLQPRGITVDQAGNLIIADSSNHRLRLVQTRTNIVTTVNAGGALASPGGAAAP